MGGLAMVAQRLGPRAASCREAAALVKAVASALSDAHQGVRTSARTAAAAIVAGDAQKSLVHCAGVSVANSIEVAVPKDLDLSSFDARHPDSQSNQQSPPSQKTVSNSRKASPQRA